MNRSATAAVGLLWSSFGRRNLEAPIDSFCGSSMWGFPLFGPAV